MQPLSSRAQSVAVCLSPWWGHKIFTQQEGQPCTLNRVPTCALNQPVAQNPCAWIGWKECSAAAEDESERVSCPLPINSKELERGRLVTDRAGPRGLLLVHLQEEDCVETLQMGTSQNPTGYTESHLHQLHKKDKRRRLQSGTRQTSV